MTNLPRGSWTAGGLTRTTSVRTLPGDRPSRLVGYPVPRWRRRSTRAQKGRTPNSNSPGSRERPSHTLVWSPLTGQTLQDVLRSVQVVRRVRQKHRGTAIWLAPAWAAYRTTWIVAAGQPLVCHYQVPGPRGGPYEREVDLNLPSVVLLSSPRLAVQRGRLGYKQLLVGQPELPSTLLHIGSMGI